MYGQQEIQAPRPDRLNWLRTFTVGETRPIEMADRKRVASCISRYLHSSTPHRFKITKVDEDICNVTRLPDELTFRFKGYDVSYTTDGMWIVYKGGTFIGTAKTRNKAKQLILEQ